MISFFRNSQSENPRNNFFIFSGVLITVLVLSAGGLSLWKRYNDPARQQKLAFENYQKQVEEAYKNDTYGGSTPEETLRLFVEALKKEDVELASKYFALDDNLSRGEWFTHLSDLKKRNLLSLMANDVATKSKPDFKNRLYENDFKFILYTDDGLVGANIDMEFNPVSKVWKIESL